MAVIGINEGWYKVKHDGKTGYLRSDLMDIIGGYSTSSSARVSAPTETGNALVDFALQYLGYSYVYGGASPSSGFDCSGFTSYVYKNFGYSLTRNATGQYRDNGVVVSKSELVPGDLVFFDAGTGKITHVGIYIGGGEFVHASSARVGVVVSSLDSSYYLNGWYGAKRVVS
jgi:cell wall-associated NlpC family hydrolase